MHPVVELPTGTVTFLFTDIEGSTRLLQKLGDDYPALLSEHHRILRSAVEAAGGVAIGTEGDSLFAAFPSAAGAITAAVSAQRRLAAQAWPRDAQVRVRMGLHTGEALVRDGTYVGLDVHRAARIASAGHGGQVLVSESARTLVEHNLPDGVELRDLGRHRLKDLTQPERIYETVIDGLPSDFPAIRSLDASPNSLPTQLTSFVGRTREVGEARRLLGSTHLLTLTGPGGTGKTRLSLQVAAESIADYPDGVFFVPLGAIEDPELVAPAIVTALGLRQAPNETPVERLGDYLRDRHLLLVVDNFEQILAAAPLLGTLLKASPGLSIVVTSRAALHLYGEKEYEVPPLALPAPGAELDPVGLSQYEAVALFIQRASSVRPGFEVTNANAAAVAEICSRLDGLPLAIELAAARVKLLPPQALLARLGQRLDSLDSGSRDLPERQRTLRGAIAWSHDLLDEATRRLFTRFSVFVDGADLAAVEAICGDPELDALACLSGLVDQSLLRQDDVEGEPRFSMLFTIRDYARERLAETGEAEATAERHTGFYLDLAEATAPRLTGHDGKRLLDQLGRENGNLRAALARAVDRNEVLTALRLGSAMWRFWQMRGLLPEGADWLRRILALPGVEDHPRERAAALEAAGGVDYWRAEMDQAMVYYQASLDLWRQIGDRRAIANALYNLGFPDLIDKREIARSKAALEESLAIFRDLDDKPMIAQVLWGLGNAYYFDRDNEAARDTLIEDVEMLRQMDSAFSLAWALHTLGLAFHRLGQTETKSAPLWGESLRHFAAVSDLSGITLLLSDFGVLAAARGDLLRSVRLSAASDRLADVGGVQLGTLVSTHDEMRASTEGLDREAVEAAVADGRRMTVDEAVAYALADEALS